MSIEYGTFWDNSVHDGVTYFFRWLGEPRATVLVVFANGHLTHIEARKAGDIKLSEFEVEPIMHTVITGFASSGFTYRPAQQN